MACKLKISLFFFVFLLFTIFGLIESCKQFQCASIISKCMLNQKCKCDWKNTGNSTCYRDCVRCLGYKYFMDCCSCVQICPVNFTDNSNPTVKSVVENFEGVPALFDKFIQLKMFWKVIVTPAHPKAISDSGEYPFFKLKEDYQNDMAKKCSVIYLNNCMSLNKCGSFCHSSGASGYRWFHNGCCECVGSNCPSHGLKKNRCRLCSKNNMLKDKLLTQKITLNLTDNEI